MGNLHSFALSLSPTRPAFACCGLFVLSCIELNEMSAMSSMESKSSDFRLKEDQ